ncbi:Kelch-like protein 10 [Nymphon striatum]|nr:Kelch-like protein 10 [Nymphon striatum]
MDDGSASDETESDYFINEGNDDGVTTLFETKESAKESAEKLIVTLPGIEERELKNIIEFAYAQKVKINDDNVQDLTVAAAQFKVIKLLEECIAYLLKNMDHHNCIGLWKFSSLYSFIKLRNQAKQFILKNFAIILGESKEYYELAVEELTEILQDDRLNVQTDKTVWGAVLKWVEFEEESRIKHYGGLLRTVRIGEYFTLEYAFKENSENPKVTTHTTDGDTNVNEVQVSSMTTGNWAHSDPGSLFTDYVHDVICKHPYSKNNKECSEYLHECPALCAPRKPSHILYVIGGFDGESSTNPTHEIETYDFMSNSWTQVSIRRNNNVFIPDRAHHGCIAIGHSIYIIGGTYGGSDGYYCSNDCFVFNTLNNSWSEISPMHVKRCYVSVAVLGDFIYAVGGVEGPNTLRTVEKYYPSSNQWNYVTSMNVAKSSASVNEINGKLYVIGGIEVFEEEDLCLNTVEMFDPDTNKWSNLPGMTVQRGHVASVSNQGYIYALGGFDGRVTLKSVERFSTSLGYWTPLQDMNEAREDFSAAVINNFIYVAGGFNGHTVLRSVECYDICQNTWHSLSPMAIPRAGFTLCFVENPTNEDRNLL